MREEVQREKIGQRLFGDAAVTRDAMPLVTRLASIGADEELVDELAGLIRRAGSLILQRPEPNDQAARDGFLDALRTALGVHAPHVDLQTFDAAVASVRHAEEGYFRILGALERSPIFNHPAPARLSAAFSRAEQRLAEVTGMMEDALASGAQFSVPGGISMTDENGEPRSFDALLTSIVEGLSGFLKMEAYRGRFFTKAGWVELPALPVATQEDLGLYGPCEALGIFWQRWERLHRKALFGDQSIEVLTGGTLPPNLSPRITQVFTRPADANFVDWAANERALDRQGIAHWDLVTTTNVQSAAKGISGTLAALPTEWIGDEEVAQTLSLSEAVGFDITQDTSRHAGLMLSEWVRGYMALDAWAKTRSDMTDPILRTSRQELVDLLTRLSLAAAQADAFLDAVSFGRKSRDLWDTPIVRTKTDWLVVGAAVSSPRLANIIPSLLASMEVQIKRKGPAFETRVLEFLCKQGLDARAVTAWRDGAEYQYDALVGWGDKLLLIECKNKGLSGNDPVRAYHFVQGLEDDIKQVERLLQGLETWPEIVTDNFGTDAAGLAIVPILLQNETFQLPGPFEGVYIYDWSALSRFFEVPYYRLAHTHQIAPGQSFLNRVAVKRIWSGEVPTADDLIAEMDAPLQLKILDQVAEVVPSVFPLDENTLAWDWSIIRHPITVEAYATACGVDPAPIVAQLKKIDDAYLAAKANGFRGLTPKLSKRAQRRQAGKDSAR
ncbi:hypothetical protein EJC49_19540 [Aquibium carbonis]|uniref:Uncharacterized protein n=1 Tax=Aquibium carbonis TaxID=2495581 RepID=A0A3R9ZYD8_9HYPH|nr:hypothetical protein [Aquibium carbonis]RST84682.1 hypothetical protein EJC49_19540 [Aquibium carbonis]